MYPILGPTPSPQSSKHSSKPKQPSNMSALENLQIINGLPTADDVTPEAAYLWNFEMRQAGQPYYEHIRIRSPNHPMGTVLQSHLW